MTELDPVADTLYGLTPAAFIPERDAAVKTARAAGDKALAAQIGGLRKPSVSAWLLNQLVRDDASLAPQLAALADGLRAAEASLDGDALRDLTRQRRLLVSSLVHRAKQLGAAAGQRVGDGVVQELDRTLMAALADPAVTAEVLSGRLTSPREHAGFGAVNQAPHLSIVGAATPPAVTLSRAGARAGAPAKAKEQDKEDERASARAKATAEAKATADAKAAAALDRARQLLAAAEERQRSAFEAESSAASDLEEWHAATAAAREAVAATERELRALTAALDRAKAKLAEAVRHEARADASVATARTEREAAREAVRSARADVRTSSRATPIGRGTRR